MKLAAFADWVKAGFAIVPPILGIFPALVLVAIPDGTCETNVLTELGHEAYLGASGDAAVILVGVGGRKVIIISARTLQRQCIACHDACKGAEAALHKFPSAIQK